MRRLFSQDIVESDAFIDMPISCQALYFHLGMHADDDGFVNPRKIMRMIGASDDDLKILLGKRFLLAFESGVVVIKHWLIHNSIRKDRYNETKYLEEKKTLFIKDNRAYTDSWQPTGNQLATNRHTQVKLSQVKLSKDNIYTSPSKDTFNAFWEMYPHKVDKKKAEHRWKSLPFEIQQIILKDIPLRKEGRQWKEKDGQFIPNPTTYLNGERWNDEIQSNIIKNNSITI